MSFGRKVIGISGVSSVAEGSSHWLMRDNSRSGDRRPGPVFESSNGIPRRPRRSRMHKQEREHRLRDLRKTRGMDGGLRLMRFVGIDVGAERLTVEIGDESGVVILKATAFTEDSAGYGRLLELLGTATDCLVAMEATGHYWRNLYAALVTAGFAVALINPLRTSRFAEEELQRTKTDPIHARGIARFAPQKPPTITQLPEAALQELRELLRFQGQVLQQLCDRARPL